jgi:hypothetical protein
VARVERVRRYVAYDLVIESEVGIPGAIPLEPDTAVAPDLTIEIGPADIGGAAAANGAYRYLDDRLLFSAPGAARFLCEAGGKVVVDPAPNADTGEIEALLVATALPAILWMRGRFVLHAAAVLMPGRDAAIAIAGPSGVGKSTVLDQLVARGAAVLADDSVSVARGAPGPIASGLPSAYFLRADDPADRRPRAVPRERWTRSARLGAIVALQRSADCPAPSFNRLDPVGAIEQALRNRHRPRIPAILGREQHTLEDCAFLASQAPIYLWRRGSGAIRLADDEIAALARCRAAGDA